MITRFINKRAVIFCIIIIVIIARTISSIYTFNFKYKGYKNNNINVKVLNVYKMEEERIIYKVKYNTDTFLLYLKDVENVHEYGDVLRINATFYDIQTNGNPYEFNYRRYLNSNGIISTIYANNAKVIKREKDFLTIVHYVRKIINKKIDNNFESTKANLLKSFLYGDDLYLDKDIKELFTNIGLGHILCVSGAHVFFLLEAFENITKARKSKVNRILILVIFYIISLFKISLLRAIIMNILSMYNRYKNVYKRYIISAIIVYIINPYYVFNIGVIFSFLSILGIIIFNSQINSFLKIKLGHKVFNQIINSVSMTISAQLLIIPFEIYAFGKITLMSIISNFIFSVCINILMKLSFSLLFLIFVPYITIILFNCLDLILNFMLFSARLLERINYLDIHLPRFNWIMYILYYLLVILIIFSDKIWVYFWDKRKIIKKGVRILKILCCGIIIFEIIYIKYFEVYVIFFNVGQGNMALVHCYTKNIIVDIGSTQENIAYNIMSSFLKAKDIKSIDLLLVTHIHSDHINGVKKLAEDENISVKRIGLSRPCTENDEYKDIIDTKVAKVYLNEEDKIKVGNISIQVLSPPLNTVIQDEDMLNANSTVYFIQNANKRYLFMGDATQKAEKIILEKYYEILEKVDVLQVSHHGSSTSSYEPFISKFNKCVCVISSKKSVYGHPSQIVLDTLNKYNLKIKITQKDNAVIF